MKGTTDDLAQRYLAVYEERDELRSEVITLEWSLSEATKAAERLRADVEAWGRIWNDAEFLAARVEALRDGTANLGSHKEIK